MRRFVTGKTVAVVGRAGSLLRSENGARIDSADVVIRVNWVLPIPPDDIPHVGGRTDLVTHCKRARMARQEAQRRNVPTLRIRGKSRKALARQFFKNPDKFRPTTGFCTIMEVVNNGARAVYLYGFDFFSSGHVQDREPDGDDYSRPLAWLHSPEQERKAMAALIQRYHHIHADTILTEALR